MSEKTHNLTCQSNRLLLLLLFVFQILKLNFLTIKMNNFVDFFFFSPDKFYKHTHLKKNKFSTVSGILTMLLHGVTGLKRFLFFQKVTALEQTSEM